MTRPTVKTTDVLAVLLALTGLPVTTARAAQGTSESLQDYRAGVLSAEFPYESKYIDVLGSRMHYIDQGQGYGRHFIQEDNPEAIGRGIVDWYRRLETKRHD